MDDETTSQGREKAPGAKDEHAYEDSWYRSLKALAEARNTGASGDDDEHEDGEAPPAGP